MIVGCSHPGGDTVLLASQGCAAASCLVLDWEQYWLSYHKNDIFWNGMTCWCDLLPLRSIILTPFSCFMFSTTTSGKSYPSQRWVWETLGRSCVGCYVFIRPIWHSPEEEFKLEWLLVIHEMQTRAQHCHFFFASCCEKLSRDSSALDWRHPGLDIWV